MLTITATDFGLAPSDIQIKDYSNSNLLVLDGEFTEEEFCKAIVDYQHRERRFGKTSEQVKVNV